MIYSYDKVYLRIAQRVLGEMLNYAVYDCGYELKEYYQLFTGSSYSERFSKGDPFIIAGMSGAELAICVMDVPDNEIVAPGYYFEKSPEYWTGWLLAYYQWISGKTFAVIQKEVPIEKIRDLYHPYHEMDITQAVQKLREIAQQSRAESYLKLLRKRAGFSQSQLAEETKIPVKTIQQYEQKQKNINHARADYIIRLAKALYCRPEDLLEVETENLP